MLTNPRKKLWSACLGNLFEHYDTALFGFLSPFLAPLIFPGKDPIAALILTYAIIPIGMLARPLGSLVFGYIGDVYGRERALFLTLAGMAFISGGIACTPTYLQAGALAPILFCLGRVVQNFLASGETMGGAILILEHVPKKRHDLLSSLYSSSAIGGHLLASLGVYTISQCHFDSGWRLLYLCGCITALFGCMFRRTSSRASLSSVKFSQTLEQLKNALWANRKPLIIIAISSGFARATYSIALVLMNGFIPLVSDLTKAQVMKINTYLLIFDFCALPVFGWVASKFSREKLMLSVSVGAVLLALPLMLALREASTGTVIAIRGMFVIFGVAFFAPFHAWAQHLIPAHCRYAVISFGYAIGSQLLGSPTAACSLWLFQKTGMISSVAWYWMLLGALASLSILVTMRSDRQVLKVEKCPL